jgi:Glycine-zipper domain
MARAWLLVPVATTLFVVGCATVPTGPSVMVLPGSGRPFDQFRADDSLCRQWALEQTGTTTKQASKESTVSGAAIGTAVGAAAGAAIGAAAGSPGVGAAAGAGAGLLGGTAIGASQGEDAKVSVQRRYDVAYMQCMYAKGHQIPVPRGAQGYTSSTPTAPAPPRNVPPPPAGPPPPPPPGATR